MSFYNSSSLSYENKMFLLENNLRAINNEYYGVSSNNNNNMEKYMYYSALSNACSASYSGNSSSCGRSMGREPNYTVGQWSIEGIL